MKIHEDHQKFLFFEQGIYFDAFRRFQVFQDLFDTFLYGNGGRYFGLYAGITEYAFKDVTGKFDLILQYRQTFFEQASIITALLAQEIYGIVYDTERRAQFMRDLSGQFTQYGQLVFFDHPLAHHLYSFCFYLDCRVEGYHPEDAAQYEHQSGHARGHDRDHFPRERLLEAYAEPLLFKLIKSTVLLERIYTVIDAGEQFAVVFSDRQRVVSHFDGGTYYF